MQENVVKLHLFIYVNHQFSHIIPICYGHYLKIMVCEYFDILSYYRFMIDYVNVYKVKKTEA